VSSVTAGAALATLYTISPLALCAAALALAAGRLARRGLSDGERRLLTTVLAAALIVRVAAIAAIFFASIPIHDDQFVGSFSGDGAYAMTRALRSRDLLLGVPANKYDYVVAFDEYGRNSYVSFLTVVQLAFGPSPYGVRLLNSVLFVAGALLLYRVTRDGLGPAPAMIGLAALLFLPTLFVWSISVLKESLYFAGTAFILWATVVTLRAREWRVRSAAALAGTAGAFLIHDLRPGAVWLTAAGIAAGLAMRTATASRRTFAGAVVAALLVAAVVAATPQVQARLLGALESTAKTQTGHVFTVGHAYKLLDEGFYFNPQPPMASTLTLTPGQSARYVLRALASFAAVPVPWQLASVRELVHLPEQLLWYAVLVLLPIGAVAGWRRDPLVTCLLLGFAAPTACVLALTNGNIGTLVRLRGMVTPYLVWVSAVGFCASLQLLARGRPGAGS
jgi:phage gp37-like protein